MGFMGELKKPKKHKNKLLFAFIITICSLLLTIFSYAVFFFAAFAQIYGGAPSKEVNRYEALFFFFALATIISFIASLVLLFGRKQK